MAVIYPFRGYRYNVEKVSDIGAVITEPYDRITPELQRKYYARHPYNIVRLIKGLPEEGDRAGKDWYARARAYLEKWISEGVLLRDEKESIYVYSQSYSLEGRPPSTRLAFIALGELEEFGEGGVMPHERTLSGPKADRLNLMRATGTQFGLIFMLYPDPRNEIRGLLEHACAGPPDIDTSDDAGVCHRVWVIQDPAVHGKVVAMMREKPLFIADGHHRYETALTYRREMREKGVTCLPGNENYDNRMMAFVSMQDPGLTILPTHRLLFGLTADQVKQFPSALARYFRLERRPDLESLLASMTEGAESGHRFGLYRGGSFSLLIMRDDAVIGPLARSRASGAWKALDVSILHAVLEELLGIDREKLESQTNVEYEREPEAAVRMVDEGRYQFALFLNPTKASQVADVASRGERMPQKSTDFYPKLYTGLVINKLNLP